MGRGGHRGARGGRHLRRCRSRPRSAASGEESSPFDFESIPQTTPLHEKVAETGGEYAFTEPNADDPAVEDDGSGFDVAEVMAAARQRKTMGLMTIIEQVEMLGGEIHFESSVGRGTKAELNLPI